MGYLSVGDLALNFMNRHRSVVLKSQLARLSQELSTGEKNDLSTNATGDFSPINGLENALNETAAYETSLNEADLFFSTIQASLDMVQKSGEKLAPALLTAGASQSETMIQATGADAENQFAAIVSALNTQVAGRYVFSGTATDTPSLTSPETILNALQSAIGPQTTASAIVAAVDTWFDTPGGGFDTLAYTGSGNPLSPFQLSHTEKATASLLGKDPKIKSALKGFALAALVGKGMLSGNIQERAALARKAGEKMLSAQQDISLIQAETGTSQARIEEARITASSHKHAMEMARSRIIGADPYQTATELEATRKQLESMYTLTVRLSRLSLAEFMR